MKHTQAELADRRASRRFLAIVTALALVAIIVTALLPTGGGW